MSKELKKQYWMLVTQLGDYEIDEKQRKYIERLINTDNSAMIDVESNLISVRSIYGILTPLEYTNYTHKRRGGWKCKYNHWHEKGQQCAHNQTLRRIT